MSECPAHEFPPDMRWVMAIGAVPSTLKPGLWLDVTPFDGTPLDGTLVSSGLDGCGETMDSVR